MPALAVVGLKDVKKILEELLPKDSRNLLRATVAGAAGVVRKFSREEAPKRSGILKKAIKSRRRRSHPDNPVAEVYTERQGFYWIFVNYGTRHSPANPFRDRAVQRFNQDRERYMVEQFNKKLAQKINREQKKLRQRNRSRR